MHILEKGSFQHLRLTDNTNSVLVSEHRPRRDRTCSQTRPNLLPDATESAPRRDRICSQTRLRLLPRSLNGIGLELGQSENSVVSNKPMHTVLLI